MSTNKDALNKANPNTLADLLRLLGFGSILRSMPTPIRKAAAGAVNTYASSTALPVDGQEQDAPAVLIASAYARAGAGTPGPLVNDGMTSVAPIAGHIAISPNGQIVTAPADAWTDLDVVYIPEKGEVVEHTGSVNPATGVMALPSAVVSRGVVVLLESEVLAGGSTGRKIILEPAAAAVAAARSALDTDKQSVWFAIADAVTSARVKLLICSAEDVNALLGDDAAVI